jgi:hypothetical protein
MRELNGGAKVKRKAKAEEAETKEKAKGSKKGGKKSK